jgi:succinoglycan biosynthesis protein ExoM
MTGSDRASVVQTLAPVLAKPTQRISVCICTLRRAALLSRALAHMQAQQTGGLFTYSVVVADNDSMRSAEKAVQEFGATAPVTVTYCVESRQNIALARNQAIEHADGDFVAFIDDDEFPADDWLLKLFKTCEETGADGVLGPVLPHFELEPPQWVKRGKFFDRPRHATGYRMGWEESRTGNVLFRKEILRDLEIPFRSRFDSAGEDMDFFRRAMAQGRRFVWCDEAVAYEVVPASRCTRSYLLKRALLRGSNFHKHPSGRLRNFVKSMVAVPAYALALPALALFGEHVFLKYLIKLLDHVSRLLAFLGWSLVTERET